MSTVTHMSKAFRVWNGWPDNHSSLRRAVTIASKWVSLSVKRQTLIF